MRSGLPAIYGVGLALMLGLAPASAQEPRHWPNEKISFPIDTEKLAALDPKPSKLRFYAAAPRGKFELIAERRIDDLEEIVDPNTKAVRKGFNYKARGDGLEEFALQYVYGNGDLVPLTTALVPQFRIAFDTRPPLVRAVASANTTVSWTAEDDNLVENSVRVEVKYPNMQDWTTIGSRAFGAKDNYTWKSIPAGQTMEVRITAKDRAGHLGQSNIVRIPTTNVGNLETGGDPFRTPSKPTGTGFGNPAETPNMPQIEYVNSADLKVKSKLTRVTRSGVKEAILWVNDGKTSWKEDKRQAVAIEANTKDPSVEMPFKAPQDGLYGFIVIPVSGAGYKPDDPRDGDAAQWLVEVDTQAPKVEIRTVRVGPGGLNGPRVEIDYTATDKNLMPEPITLEYAKNPNSPDKEWKTIAAKVANSSRYVWEVEEKELWKVYIRVKTVDKANNTTTVEYKDPVLVDLEKPSAVIEKVNGGNGPVNRNFRPDEMMPPPIPAPTTPLTVTPQPMTPIEAPKPVEPVKQPMIEAKPMVPQPPLPKPSTNPTPPPKPELPITAPPVANPTPQVPEVTPPKTPEPSIPNLPPIEAPPLKVPESGPILLPMIPK